MNPGARRSRCACPRIPPGASRRCWPQPTPCWRPCVRPPDSASMRAAVARTVRSFLALGATLLCAGGLVACGDSVPSGSIAKVADVTISKASFDHWLLIAEKSQIAATAPAASLRRSTRRTSPPASPSTRRTTRSRRRARPTRPGVAEDRLPAVLFGGAAAGRSLPDHRGLAPGRGRRPGHQGRPRRRSPPC